MLIANDSLDWNLLSSLRLLRCDGRTSHKIGLMMFFRLEISTHHEVLDGSRGRFVDLYGVRLLGLFLRCGDHFLVVVTNLVKELDFFAEVLAL